MLKEKLCHSNTVVESSVHHWSPAILRGDSNHDTNDDVIKYLGSLGGSVTFCASDTSAFEFSKILTTSICPALMANINGVRPL